MDKKYNHESAEQTLQIQWEQEKIYSHTNNPGPQYNIDTPPPTVSGSLHIGHVFSYTQTDIIARFKRMSSFSVFYPFGFDNNGLPTEIDIIATIGLEQMKKLPKHLEFRRHIQDRYNKELHPVFERPPHSETVQYYCLRLPIRKGIGRNNLIDYLADKKIHTSVHFKPLYKYEFLSQNREYPVSEKEWVKLISLPCHNRMVEGDIDYVVHWTNKFMEEIYDGKRI